MVEKQSNNQGGKRSGAGRKKGEPNKRSAEAKAMAEATGIMPLEYLLTVMRDAGGDPRERISAAIAAAPYVHAKLSSIEVSGKDGAPIDHSLTVSFVGVV